MTQIDDLHDWADKLDWTHIPEDKYDSVGEHWYVVSDWYVEEDLEMFRQFRDFINRHGSTQFYAGKSFDYVVVDGWRYWISASHYSKGVCLNRRRDDDDEA